MEAGGGGIWSGGRGGGPLSVNPRVEFLRSLINLEGRGLEIGPGYNPLVPKAEGFRVETADYTDAAGLRAKYAEAQVDASRIEEVDHVLEGGQTLAEAIGRPGAFDYLVASHVIEHTPDLLGFLKSCETLLAPDGVLLLAIPDKRHCFDVFQPLTTTGSVLQAHLDGRIRPTPGAIFDDSGLQRGAGRRDHLAAGRRAELAVLRDVRAGAVGVRDRRWGRAITGTCMSGGSCRRASG